MWAFLVDLFGSHEAAAFFTVLFSSLASLLLGQHPAVAGVFSWLAGFFRSKAAALVLIVVVLVLSGGFARANPPVGTVVIATDNGKAYVMCADGKFRPHQPQARPACICNDSCKCAPGACPAKCPVQGVRSGCACVPHVPGTPWNPATNCGYFVCPTNGGRGGCPCASAPGVQTLWQSGPGVLGTSPQTFGPIRIPDHFAPSCPNGRCNLNGR